MRPLTSRVSISDEGLSGCTRSSIQSLKRKQRRISMRPATLSLTSARHIDEVCNRFETALKAKQALPIEDYLGDAAEPMYSALLRELVRLEIDYRVRSGEEPTVDEYRSRFPTHAASIASW